MLKAIQAEDAIWTGGCPPTNSNEEIADGMVATASVLTSHVMPDMAVVVGDELAQHALVDEHHVWLLHSMQDAVWGRSGGWSTPVAVAPHVPREGGGREGGKGAEAADEFAACTVHAPLKDFLDD